MTVDHLGSTRMLTSSSTSPTVRRYDYLPFGGDILAGVNGRTTGMGYLSALDATDPRFTGKNRDEETLNAGDNTALDWFEVRYLSASQGRFQSPDPANAGVSPLYPQTWNAYSYVGNTAGTVSTILLTGASA